MVTLLNFLAQILVHFSKTLEHQDHLVDLFSQCSDSTGGSPLTRFFEPTEKNRARGKTVLEENTV